MVADLHKVTAEWERKPEFKVDIKTDNNGGYFIISTDDKVFHYLNKGTRVRRAVMTDPFRAKTSYMYLGSDKGEGGVYVNPNTGRPAIGMNINRPGISARRWTIALFEKYRQQKTFSQNIMDSLMGVLKRFFGGK